MLALPGSVCPRIWRASCCPWTIESWIPALAWWRYNELAFHQEWTWPKNRNCCSVKRQQCWPSKATAHHRSSHHTTEHHRSSHHTTEHNRSSHHTTEHHRSSHHTTEHHRSSHHTTERHSKFPLSDKCPCDWSLPAQLIGIRIYCANFTDSQITFCLCPLLTL